MPVSVAVSPVGPVACATMVYRDNGKLFVAVIVKATFAFAHHGPLRIAPPEPIFTKEAHRMNNPTRSIVAASDLVPRLPGADVLLLGQAHAPSGATQMAVRLAVGRGETTLLDKRVLVRGDVKGDRIEPFVAMPLVYEKAFGGLGNRDNPLGTGAAPGDAPPNVLDPEVPDRPAGFAPVSKSWHVRSQLASREVRSALERPIAEIPPGFDFRYFHAAPADQRTAQLVGDEWIVLEGVHPEHAHVHLVLPGATAMVRVTGTDADGRVFSLRPDTLRIDAEAERITVIWRNSLPAREGDLESMRLVAGVALPDAPIVWPSHTADVGRAAGSFAGSSIEGAGAGGTMVIRDAPSAPTFGGTMVISDDDLEAVSEAAPDLSRTTVLTEGAARPTAHLPGFLQTPPQGPQTGTLPRAPAAPPQIVQTATLPRSAPPARSPFEGTLDFTNVPEMPARSALPFSGNAAAPPAETARSKEPIPGAPWAVAERESSPPPIAPPPPPIAPPPPLVAAPPPNEPAARAADPWGRDLETPAPAPPPPPSKPADSAPRVGQSLYKRFKK